MKCLKFRGPIESDCRPVVGVGAQLQQGPWWSQDTELLGKGKTQKGKWKCQLHIFSPWPLCTSGTFDFVESMCVHRREEREAREQEIDTKGAVLNHNNH